MLTAQLGGCQVKIISPTFLMAPNIEVDSNSSDYIFNCYCAKFFPDHCYACQHVFTIRHNKQVFQVLQSHVIYSTLISDVFYQIPSGKHMVKITNLRFLLLQHLIKVSTLTFLYILDVCESCYKQ
jgi:hypothetical protein